MCGHCATRPGNGGPLRARAPGSRRVSARRGNRDDRKTVARESAASGERSASWLFLVVRRSGRLAPQMLLMLGKSDRFVVSDEGPADRWSAVDSDFYVNTADVQPCEALDPETVGAGRPQERRRRQDTRWAADASHIAESLTAKSRPTVPLNCHVGGSSQTVIGARAVMRQRGVLVVDLVRQAP